MKTEQPSRLLVAAAVFKTTAHLSRTTVSSLPQSDLRTPDPAAMDPAPQTHPVLSYVLSRIPTLSKPKPAAPEFDIEQPPPRPRAPPTVGKFELVGRMPGLRRPPALRAMARAVADVSAARSALQALGPRPDHELADSSRAVVVAAEEAGDARVPEGGVEACRAVVRLEEAHDAYEALLREAEARLERVYRSAMEGTDIDEDAAEGGKDDGPAAGGNATVQEAVVRCSSRLRRPSRWRACASWIASCASSLRCSGGSRGSACSTSRATSSR
jgi:hypothetical protein